MRGVGLLACLVLLVVGADAGSFLSGSLRWRYLEGGETGPVLVRVETVTYWSRDFSPFVGSAPDGKLAVGDAVKLSAQNTVLLDYGDGETTFINGTVVDVHTTGVIPWVGVHSVHIKEYASRARAETLREVFEGDGDVRDAAGKTFVIDYTPWTLSLTGCCRYKDQSNDPGLKFMVQGTVNTAKADASPDPRTLPEVPLVSMSPMHTSFTVASPLPSQSPAAPVSGVVQWSWCPSVIWTAPSWGSGAYAPSIDSLTGVVTWPSAIDTTGTYHLCVHISANPRDAAQGVFTQSDFRVLVQPSDTIAPSLVLTPHGVPGAFSMLSPFWISAHIGFANSFEIGAVANSSDSSLAVVSGFRGTGSTLSFLQGNGTLTATLSVSPQLGYEGWMALCFSVEFQGLSNVSSMGCINMNVTQDAAPVISASAAQFQVSSLGFRLREGQQLEALINGFKPAEEDNVTVVLRSDIEGAQSFSPVSIGNNASSLFVYIPPRADSGRTNSVCFAARGADGPLRVQEEAVTCVSVEIERCVWTVREGESLLSLSHDLGISWLQLWNFNKRALRQPDKDLRTGDGIMVGQEYEVQRGDSLYNIATRFSTTVQRLLTLNADLSEEAELRVGQRVCVTFDSCAANAA
uniref:LysM domain-containing protein n=2 Tax=Hemiselmis andersenii TaxID=464988 RepID=A0A6U4VFF1_HEMAN|mmetsp:Transcript_14622/g.33734  ORF Transcript_14622/g.33734 Transcript_14622/m.33734 type:complete len:631 (-) Transcript_14622:99-1991(-)